MSGWRPVTQQEAPKLEQELARELPAGHVLKSRTAEPQARRDDCDDVAFLVAGAGLCLVHLTWQVESDPRWPHSEFVEALPGDDE
jgi:hypothetical protein